MGWANVEKVLDILLIWLIYVVMDLFMVFHWCDQVMLMHTLLSGVINTLLDGL